MPQNTPIEVVNRLFESVHVVVWNRSVGVCQFQGNDITDLQDFAEIGRMPVHI
jgi:hypothetical protein